MTCLRVQITGLLHKKTPVVFRASETVGIPKLIDGILQSMCSSTRELSQDFSPPQTPTCLSFGGVVASCRWMKNNICASCIALRTSSSRSTAWERCAANEPARSTSCEGIRHKPCTHAYTDHVTQQYQLEQSTCWRPVCLVTYNISSEAKNSFISAILHRHCVIITSP